MLFFKPTVISLPEWSSLWLGEPRNSQPPRSCFQPVLFLILSLAKAIPSILWGCCLLKKMLRMPFMTLTLAFSFCFVLPYSSDVDLWRWPPQRTPGVQCGGLAASLLQRVQGQSIAFAFLAPSNSRFGPLLRSGLAQLNNFPFKSSHLVH